MNASNVVDRSDPRIRAALRRAGLLNAHNDVQSKYLSTADLRAPRKPGKGIERKPFRRASIKRIATGPNSFELLLPDGRQVLWPDNYMPEEGDEGWQTTAEDMLAEAGWTFWHPEEPHLQEAGFFDLVCLRERVIWIELKVRSRDGKANGLNAAQKRFLAALFQSGSEAHVFLWPDDFETFKDVIK